MMNLQISKNDGFTVLELVIVMVILSVLAAIAIPKFGQVMIEAKKSGCIYNMRTIYSQVDVYMMSENEDYDYDDGGEKLVEEGYIFDVKNCPAGGEEDLYEISGTMSNMNIEIKCPLEDRFPDHVIFADSTDN